MPQEIRQLLMQNMVEAGASKVVPGTEEVGSFCAVTCAGEFVLFQFIWWMLGIWGVKRSEFWLSCFYGFPA